MDRSVHSPNGLGIFDSALPGDQLPDTHPTGDFGLLSSEFSGLTSLSWRQVGGTWSGPRTVVGLQRARTGSLRSLVWLLVNPNLCMMLHASTGSVALWASPEPCLFLNPSDRAPDDPNLDFEFHRLRKSCSVFPDTQTYSHQVACPTRRWYRPARRSAPQYRGGLKIRTVGRHNANALGRPSAP